MRLIRLESKLRLNFKKPVTAGPKSKLKRVKEPVICFLRPKLINLSQGINVSLEINPLLDIWELQLAALVTSCSSDTLCCNNCMLGFFHLFAPTV
jgi:hypothetical protein